MTRFLVIGDATLDVTVAPSRPIRGGGDVTAVIRLGPGGQGANVAVRLARRRARVRLAAPVGDDAGGRLIREALAADRVELAAIPVARSSVVVALLDAEGERSMLSDRQHLAAAAVDGLMARAGWIHVSAYALLDDQEGDALARVLVNREGARLSVAGGSIPPEPALVARFRARIGAVEPDLLLVSRDEAAALLGHPSHLAPQAALRLSDLADLVVVTGGRQGSVAAVGGATHEVPAAEVPGPVLDATGSGDAFLAVLVLELAGASWPPEADLLRRAMENASQAGALVARAVGAQAGIAGEAER